LLAFYRQKHKVNLKSHIGKVIFNDNRSDEHKNSKVLGLVTPCFMIANSRLAKKISLALFTHSSFIQAFEFG
jgi:hypothetical protein